MSPGLWVPPDRAYRRGTLGFAFLPCEILLSGTCSDFLFVFN